MQRIIKEQSKPLPTIVCSYCKQEYSMQRDIQLCPWCYTRGVKFSLLKSFDYRIRLFTSFGNYRRAEAAALKKMSGF